MVLQLFQQPLRHGTKLSLVPGADLGYFVAQADEESYAGSNHENQIYPLPRARFERYFTLLFLNRIGRRLAIAGHLAL